MSLHSEVDNAISDIINDFLTVSLLLLRHALYFTSNIVFGAVSKKYRLNNELKASIPFEQFKEVS